MTRVLIQSADAVRSDTVVLRQRGARVPAMAFEGGTSTNVPGSSGGKASVRFGTNIAPDELTFTTQYDAGEEPAEEWLFGNLAQPAGEEEYTFNFDYAGNDTDELRTVTVTVSLRQRLGGDRTADAQRHPAYEERHAGDTTFRSPNCARKRSRSRKSMSTGCWKATSSATGIRRTPATTRCRPT